MKPPWFCRRIFGLRPGQWMIFIGALMATMPALLTTGHLRIGQVLILVGMIGLMVLWLTEHKPKP